MIEAIVAAQHEVRASKAVRMHRVLDQCRPWLPRQPFDDRRREPAVDTDAIAAADVDPRVVCRRLGIHAEIDDKARHLQHRPEDAPPAGGAEIVGSGREAFAALGSPRRQHPPTGRGRHPRPKSMTTLAYQVTGLVSPLHGTDSRSRHHSAEAAI